MHYVVSDIHGCFHSFKRLLAKLNFKKEDTLYVLGDVVDRGEQSVEVLSYMAQCSNIIPLMGNHEWMMMQVLPHMLGELTEEKMKVLETDKFCQDFQLWMINGGKTTMDSFHDAEEETQEFLLDYVKDFSLYEEVEIGKKYFLIHSLPSDYYDNPTLERSIEDILFGRPNFKADWSWLEDKKIIVGHTPTPLVDSRCLGAIYHSPTDHLIDIDCGCVFGQGCSLAAYCLETEEEFYVEKGEK